jgi:outer membrane lipoprotein-sorting protein
MVRRTVLLLLPFLASATAFAQETPSADDLVQKNVTARGGTAKIKAVKTIKVTGTAQTQGIELPLTIWVKRPAMFRLEMVLQGKKIVQAFDGTDAWGIVPMMGSDDPKKAGDEQTKAMRDSADEMMDGPLMDYKERGAKLEVMGKEDVEGSPAYKIKITKKDGAVKYTYLDGETYLDVRTTETAHQMGQEMTVDSYLSNYKAEAGVLIPHAIEQRAGGQAIMKMSLDQVEVNAPVDDSLFQFPVKPDAKPAEKK